MIVEIKAAARRHLATDGANLSLRAVARDLNMVSSAIYRYFPSRDDLLTALIIDAYNDLGEVAEQAEQAISRADLAGRHRAVAHAIREWALANQPEYALLYGSPVPGYAAPQDTIEPATRPVLVLMSILRDGVAAGVISTPTTPRLPKPTRVDLKRLGSVPDFAGIPEAVLADAIGGWAMLFGVINFELFGRLVNTITDYAAFYDYQVKAISRRLGLG
jgi:AcrR family transcriptional regulator